MEMLFCDVTMFVLYEHSSLLLLLNPADSYFLEWWTTAHTLTAILIGIHCLILELYTNAYIN